MHSHAGYDLGKVLVPNSITDLWLWITRYVWEIQHWHGCDTKLDKLMKPKQGLLKCAWCKNEQKIGKGTSLIISSWIAIRCWKNRFILSVCTSHDPECSAEQYVHKIFHTLFTILFVRQKQKTRSSNVTVNQQVGLTNQVTERVERVDDWLCLCVMKFRMRGLFRFLSTIKSRI